MLTRLRDGTPVAIRRIRPNDKDLLARGLELLPEETRVRRFLGPKSRFSSAELRYLTEVDGRAHFALVAVLAERPSHVVAVARYVRFDDDPATADAAIVVGDPWQRQGLGRTMALMLADVAAANGVRRISAAMLTENPGPLALMRAITARLEQRGQAEGIREVVAHLAA